MYGENLRKNLHACLYKPPLITLYSTVTVLSSVSFPPRRHKIMANANCIILALSLVALLSLHHVEARPSPSAAPTAPDHLTSSRGAVPPALKAVCYKTEFPNVCISKISPLIGLTQKTNPTLILHLGLKALVRETHKAINQTKTLFNDPNTKPEIADCLMVCLESYDDVLQNNDKAIPFIPGKDVGQLEAPLDATITMINDCNDAFTELTTEESPLKKINQNLLAIAKNNVGMWNALTA